MACLGALGGLLFLAVLSASAQPVEKTGIPGVFGFKPGPSDKARQLAATHRAMRRAGCDDPVQAARIQACRQLQARAHELGAEPRKDAPRAARRPKIEPRVPARTQVARWSADPARSYRTMCVRLCDGFYFPVSEASRPASFADDEAKCRSSCSSPAALFYMSGPEAEPEQMVALSGKRYADLPNAFRYRTVYDETCACKPLPWTEEAKAAYERRVILALRTRNERRVAAGAGEAAKILAESEIEVAEARAPPTAAAPRKPRYSRQVVVVDEAKIEPKFRLFRSKPTLLAPAEGGETPPKRRFFLFR